MTDGPTEFYLSEDEPAFETTRGKPLWVPFEREHALYLGLALASGETATSPELSIDFDTTLVCDVASGAVSLTFRSEQESVEIARIGTPLAATIDLSPLHGRSGRFVIDADEDSTILKWLVGRADRIGLLAARSHHSRRLSNETAHFTTHYDGDFHKSRGSDHAVGAFATPSGRLKETQAGGMLPDAMAIAALPEARPRPDENAYEYGHRLLEALSGRPPNFQERLRSLYRDRPVRILSLCSGAAGVERRILEGAGVPAEITLVDINEYLMGRAAAALAPSATVFGIIDDVNSVSFDRFDHLFDVVMCVSALHHVVELEAVLSTASLLLDEGGEFWVVGEQVGRNGNRLWAEARGVANAAFAALPSELRKNCHRGEIDMELPENDFSAMSFEGIRSSEIEGLLNSFFEPVEVYRHSCFLWRVLEATYFSNYDLTDVGHRNVVHGLVAEEYALSRSGGRPTQLWAAYRRR